MTFSTTLSTDIGKVRLELGDDVSGSGILPTGANLTDEQIQVYLDRNSDVSNVTLIMRTVADICEALATRYAPLTNISVGSRREDLAKISEQYASRAKELRDKYGGSSDVVSVGWLRTDGYSDDIATDKVTATGAEYEGSFVYVRSE